MATRHFLDIDRVDPTTLRGILNRGVTYKRALKAGEQSAPFAGRTLAIILEKPSTRTRVSFEVGMQQLGGRVVVLKDAESQFGRGETLADTARVLSRYVDLIVIRTDASAKLEELASHATVPVINGLTDLSHPCQIMADVMTFEEHRGPIQGRSVAWSGDGNNVASSWIHAAARFRFRLKLACPKPLWPRPEVLSWARAPGGDVDVTEDADDAVNDADLVVTDTWVSMGQANAQSRHNLLRPYQIDERRMTLARPDALFMHCLPAHRGEEVTPGVIDGPRSVVWDEAENRLHVQKGIIAWCLG